MLLATALCGGRAVWAVPTVFDIPAQNADAALARFVAQTHVNLLYAPAELREVQSTAVHDELEPGDALVRLLHGTGYGARLQNGAYLVTRIPRPRSELVGRITTGNSAPNGGTLVAIPDLHRSTTTNRHGEYRFDDVPLGTYLVVANRAGFHPLHIENVHITPDLRTYLAPAVLRPAHETTELAPVVVEGHLNRRGPLDPGPTIWGPRRAGGNLDLTRTLNDALPFIIYDRDRITRSGSVNLNDFLRREILDTDATALPPEQNGTGDLISSGSSNLNLRGFDSDETVVLVNGRRLPEVLTATNLSGGQPGYQPPDVNFIPLSLVQQVQVLPASASALYSGNAIGGVINILLRPDGERRHSEVTATYTNATEGFDAPDSSVSLLHSESWFDGKLSLRLNANFIETTPATDAELKYHRDNAPADVSDTSALFRATPNVRATRNTSLFPDVFTRVTSVAPGADGTGGLTAFEGREGVRNYALYDSPGTLANAIDGIDFPYGREQRRALYFASAVYTVSDHLELGFDAAYSSTRINRGYDVFEGDLLLREDNPLNPFGTDVRVSLYETPVDLGQDYSEAQIDFTSLVGSALITLPWDFKAAIDTQYAHSSTKYRGIADVDNDRWQALVDRGDYNPLRDTQVFGPSQAFYDEVLIFSGGRDQFITLGDYETFDGAFRLTHEDLPLPTGRSVFNLGADYRIMTLKGYDAVKRYGDGSLVAPPDHWVGRTLERFSVFTELQAPLYPRERLPNWIDSLEGDFATRVIIADTAAETNVAPTIAIKLGLANGLTFRGSFTTSNRFPTPYMSRNLGNGVDTGTGVTYKTVKSDPKRPGDDEYRVLERSVLNPGLQSENAVTQTFGVIYERGERNRFRASLDFFDTRKTNEIVGLGQSELLNLEAYYPERVIRADREPGDPYPVGRVTEFRTGAYNLASRHSQNLMASVDFARSEFLGGTMELRSRVMWFPKFDRQYLPTEPYIDEIRDPSGGATTSLLEYRATYGATWSTKTFAVGFDGQYFHSRRLPEKEWALQGARTIDPYWQTDIYVQGDLGHWLLPEKSRFGLKGQLRINNVFKKGYPIYANESSGAGVQPYGDWRGRTISLSLTAEY